MSRPGFYNDNEFRAYPFIYTVPPGAGSSSSSSAAPALPNAVVVDAGVIMGLDSQYDAATHSVWLAAIRRANDIFTFEFATDAPGAIGFTLTFTRALTAQPWDTEFAESAAVGGPTGCEIAPVWEGFLVTGPLGELAAILANGESLEFNPARWVLEQGVIQSLVKSYVRSINVGNKARVVATLPDACLESSEPITEREVVVYSRCIQGVIAFKEGYNCRIRQNNRTNELRISAESGAGAPFDTTLCAQGGELPFYLGDEPPPGRPFFSGGPACNEVISTINGVHGENVNLVGGTGVSVIPDAGNHKITIKLNRGNLVGACAQ